MKPSELFEGPNSPLIKAFDQAVNFLETPETWEKRFEKDFYGVDDALFDRKGNNVSRQIENFIATEIERAVREERERLLPKEGTALPDNH